MPRIDAGFEVDTASLVAARERITRGVFRSGKAAVSSSTKWLEDELEGITAAAVSARLAKAWSSKTYPEGARLSENPTGIVYVKGGRRSKGVMTYMTRPGRIQPRSGRILWFPLPAAGPRGWRQGGKWVDNTPKEWERRTGQKLRLVLRRNKAPLLVLDEGRLSGAHQLGKLAGQRARASGRGVATVPLFVGLPSVAFGNRFSIDPTVRRAKDRLQKEFLERVGRTR